MSNSVWDWSPTAANNNAAAPYGWTSGSMKPTDVEPTARQMMATLAEAVHSQVAGGTADALTVTLTNAPTAYTDGMEIKFRAAAANATTTPTLNVSSLGAKTITRDGGAALQVGDIAGNLAEYSVRYNLANTRWELVNPHVPLNQVYPKFRAYQSAGQNIPLNTWTKLVIDTVNFDTNSNYDNVTNYRFTPTVSGYYHVRGSLTYSTTGLTVTELGIYVNGAQASIAQCDFPTASGLQSTIMLDDLIHMNGSTDYLELWTYQSNGSSSAATTVSGGTRLWFAAERVPD